MRTDHVDDVTGVTYYKDEDGLAQKLELDPKKGLYPGL